MQNRFLNRHILPFFIPHEGCPHQCVFCNQKKISGQEQAPTAEEITKTIQNISGYQPEIAFYGGSFTAIPIEKQIYYLQPAWSALQQGQISGIRLSTRPDAIDDKVIQNLLAYGVDTVELGVQSFTDSVLQLSGRGHNADCVEKAVAQLHDYGIAVGLQLLPGLPGDNRQFCLQGVQKAISLQPDFVRIYPALVVDATPLADLWRTGAYQALSLTEAVTICQDMAVLFGLAHVPVIRFGLQPTAELRQSVLAGPYHESFGQLVQSALYLQQARLLCAKYWRQPEKTVGQLRVNPQEISTVIGQKKGNLQLLRKQYPPLSVQADSSLAREDLALQVEGDTYLLKRDCFYQIYAQNELAGFL